MTTKLILRITVALSILLAASSVVAACVGIARAINRAPTAAEVDQERSPPYLSSQAMAGDELFGPAAPTSPSPSTAPTCPGKRRAPRTRTTSARSDAG